MLYGGRWNPVGTGVIYSSSNPSLAVLEILTQYDVVPTDYVLTQIEIPETLGVRVVEAQKCAGRLASGDALSEARRPRSRNEIFGGTTLRIAMDAGEQVRAVERSVGRDGNRLANGAQLRDQSSTYSVFFHQICRSETIPV
jgi:hypothetical protein